jgi:hypothetical protein
MTTSNDKDILINPHQQQQQDLLFNEQGKFKL